MIPAFRIVKFTLILFLFGQLAYGQDWQWAKIVGNAEVDLGKAIAVDAAGNSYITGNFNGTISFGSFVLTASRAIEGSNDIYVAKYDANGKVMWARQAGGTSYEDSPSIVVDAAGNSYITGVTHSEATFGSVFFQASGGGNVFVAKYDANGNQLWVSFVSGHSSSGIDLTLDHLGGIYVTGRFERSANFGTVTLASNTGASQIFIAKYNSDGQVIWAKQVISTKTGFGLGVTVDLAGNSYLTGFFNGLAVFGNNVLQSKDFNEAFIAKYNAAGEVIWAKAFGENGSVGRDIALDGAGNIYVTGYFYVDITLGKTKLISKGYADIYLAKFDAAGNALWVTGAGEGRIDQPENLRVDAAGNCLVIGYFEEEISFGPFTFIGKGKRDIFITQYDPEGQVRWAKAEGGPGPDEGMGIGQDKRGNIYVVGQIEQTITLENTKLTSRGVQDILIAKLSFTADPTISIPTLMGTDFCVGSTIPVSFTTTGNFDAGNRFSVQLSDARGSFASPILIGTGSVSPINVTLPKTIPVGRSYRMRVLASSPAISGEANSQGLTLTSLPQVSAGNDETICALVTTYLLSGFSPAGGTWSGIGVNATGEFKPALAQVGTHTLTYTVQSGSCRVSSTKTITVNAPPVLAAALLAPPCGNSSSGLAPYQVQFTNTTSGATRYFWEFGDGSTSSEAAPTHEYQAKGNYPVFLTAYNGTDCFEKRLITHVLVEEKRPLPNIITPNGDGKNDAFVVQLSCLALNLRVYNRMGRLVFEQANYQNTWQGEHLAAGTYFYHLTEASGLTWKGWVEVVK